MKKRLLSILLILCMVLALCPLAAFAEETHTATFIFDHGTLQLGDVTVTDSPYALSFTEEDGFTLGSITDCEPYTFLGWKDVNDNAVYLSGEWVESFTDIAFEAVYQGPPTLAITVDGFEVGKTPNDCTYSVESTIPGVTFGKDDVADVAWNKYVEELGRWESIYDDEQFEADTRYGLYLELNDKGLSELPAVTINGKTPESCRFNTDNRRIVMACEFDTPAEPPAPSLVIGDIDLDGEVTVKDAIMLQDCLENPESFEKLTSEQYKAADFNGDGKVTESDLTALRSFLNLITIDGPDVVCAQQDYEFTVTPPAGVTLNEPFRYENDDAEGYTELTIDEDGVGHGVVPASEYGDADSMVLTVHGTSANGKPATATKTVQISKEHLFVDGVCGCGAVQQYTITYDGVEGVEGSIPAGVKTHGEDFTLSSETFTWDGFIQTGWIDKYSAIYDLGGVYTLDEDMTFSPYWEKTITLTVPYTTTVALGDVGVPGEKTFTLALIGDSAPDKDKSNVTVSGSVTTNGMGSYNGTLTFTGPERTLWHMLSEGAFVQQVDNGEAGWTVDDTVWGVLMEEIPVAYAMSDDAVASEYTVYAVPASIDGQGNYTIDWENVQKADMTFTITYTAHAYELKHDATHHWDECACKDVQNKELHKYGDWKVTKEATQTAKGEKEHTCTVCGYTEKVEIPKRTTVASGDDSSFALWAALFAVSAAAVITTATVSKRKKAGR